MSEATPRLHAVMGANLRRLRQARGLTLEDIARTGRLLGLSWTTSSVGDIESGRRAPTIQTLLILAEALDAAMATDEKGRTRLADFFSAVDGAPSAQLTDKFDVDLALVADALNGKPVSLRLSSRGLSAQLEMVGTVVDDVRRAGADDRSLREIDEAERSIGLAERRAGQSLDVRPLVVALASQVLWGKSLSEERDERAGISANAQRRGRITRELLTELREHIDKSRKLQADGND